MVETLRLKAKEQKGFTLIELLAVIVILGIIAAIAIPAIGNVITKSDNKAKVQDALLIINAAKLYVAENPPASAVAPGVQTVLSLNPAASEKDLGPYLDRVKDEGFKVTVTAITKSATDSTVQYSYSISNHGAVKVVDPAKTAATDSVTEKDLSKFK